MEKNNYVVEMTAWGQDDGRGPLKSRKTGNVSSVCGGGTILVLQTAVDRVHVWVVPRLPPHHNQKLLPPLASLILLPAPRKGGMSEQSCGEQNKQSDASGGGCEEGEVESLGWRWGCEHCKIWLMTFWKYGRCHDFQLALNARLCLHW